MLHIVSVSQSFSRSAAAVLGSHTKGWPEPQRLQQEQKTKTNKTKKRREKVRAGEGVYAKRESGNQSPIILG